MKTICIDFDGVLHDYSKGWLGVDVFIKPISGASEFTHTLKDRGWTIILHTTRNDSLALRKFLSENNIIVDYVNYNPNQPKGAEKGKIIADIYLDDRGMCFKGNFNQTLKEISTFFPWQEKVEDMCPQ